MSGLEIEKQRLKVAFEGGKMPDFENMVEASPLRVESKFSSHNRAKSKICPDCDGEVLINIPTGNGFCVNCDYKVTGKL